MSNRVYDIMKYIAQYVLPALATFICALGTIWGLNYTEQIALTIMALDTMLGVCLGISSNKYYKNLDIEREDSI